MDGSESVILVVGIALGLLLVWACFIVFKYLAIALFGGAAALFQLAAEQGFLGLAAYFACWVFLFPVMLIGSLICGFPLAVAARESKHEEKQERKARKSLSERQKLGYDE